MSQDVDWQALGPKVVSLAAQGLPNAEIAARVNCPSELVLEWRKQFYEHAHTDVERSGTRAA
jgi:transposase-like protein